MPPASPALGSAPRPAVWPTPSSDSACPNYGARWCSGHWARWPTPWPRLRDYAHLAELYLPEMTPDVLDRAYQIFVRLVHRERANCVVLYRILDRLPVGMARDIREALTQSLSESTKGPSDGVR
jgi:hypothetical protein